MTDKYDVRDRNRQPAEEQPAERQPQTPAEYMAQAERKASSGLLDHLLKGAEDRREKRRDARETRPNQLAGAGGDKLQNEGGVASLELPKGFKKKTEDNDFGKYIEYGSGKTKVCYWKRDDYQPSEESAKQLKDILKKPPHVVFSVDPKNPDISVQEDKEIDAVYDCLNPGRWSGQGPFDIHSITTKNVNGKSVIQVDMTLQNGKVGVLNVFDANAKDGTLEHVWIEGPKNEVDKLKKPVFDGLSWTHKDVVAPAPQPVAPGPPKRRR